MPGVLLVLGICLGVIITLVGIGVVVVLATRTQPPPPASPAPPYDAVIADIQQQSDAFVYEFTDLLNQATKKGSTHER